jgi:hypothetical protein
MTWENTLKAPFTTDNFHVRTNMPDADFWLQHKGSEKSVGTLKVRYDDKNRDKLETASKYDWGVKILNPKIDKEHLMNWVADQHNKGEFRIRSKGTLTLVHINIRDVKEVLDRYVIGQRTPEEVKESEKVVEDLYKSLLQSMEMAARLSDHPRHKRKASKIHKYITEMVRMMEGDRK